ncbi:MAG: hypothetical protein Q9227_007375 [Pyrenula ochraceoflavens]
MSSIKYGPAAHSSHSQLNFLRQVQDLEKQLSQARQTINHLRSLVPKAEAIAELEESSQQLNPDLPKIGVPPLRRPKPSLGKDFSKARANVRDYGRGLFKMPPPYRRVEAQAGMPPQIPPLPERSSADQLVECYYDIIHPVFPILHWPTFMEEYRRVYEHGGVSIMHREWGAVLFCVFALGTLHHQDREMAKHGRTYLMQGISMIDLWQDELSIDQAKMATLTSLFLFEANLKSASWVWLGTAVRIAQDSGLHVHSEPWPRIEAETRKRVWYSIYIWDRLLALDVAKPVLIADEDFDTELPEPVDDRYITDQGPLPNAEPSTPLLATLAIARSIQSALKLFKSPTISKETLQSREQYLIQCMERLPKNLQLSSTDYLDPRFLAPIIHSIGNARQINTACGRNLSFFLRCLFERFQRGQAKGLELDEEIMVYLSGDMQSSTERSWIWQDSETGTKLPTLGKRKEPDSPPEPRPHIPSPDYHRKKPSGNESTIPGVLSDEEQANWGSWESIEQQVQYLLDQQSKQLGLTVPTNQQQLTPISPQQTPDGSLISPAGGSALVGRVTTGLPSLGVNTQRNTQSMTPISASSPSSANRMTIANII